MPLKGPSLWVWGQSALHNECHLKENQRSSHALGESTFKTKVYHTPVTMSKRKHWWHTGHCVVPVKARRRALDPLELELWATLLVRSIVPWKSSCCLLRLLSHLSSHIFAGFDYKSCVANKQIRNVDQHIGSVDEALATNPADLSSTPRTHVVEEEIWLWQVVLSSPQVHCSMCVGPHSGT